MFPSRSLPPSAAGAGREGGRRWPDGVSPRGAPSRTARRSVHGNLDDGAGDALGAHAAAARHIATVLERERIDRLSDGTFHREGVGRWWQLVVWRVDAKHDPHPARLAGLWIPETVGDHRMVTVPARAELGGRRWHERRLTGDGAAHAAALARRLMESERVGPGPLRAGSPRTVALERVAGDRAAPRPGQAAQCGLPSVTTSRRGSIRAPRPSAWSATTGAGWRPGHG